MHAPILSSTTGPLLPLFHSGYRFSPETQSLIEGDAHPLRARLAEMVDRSMRDRQAVEETDRPEIDAVVYTTHPLLLPPERGLLFLADRGDITPLEAARRLDRQVVDYQGAYDGAENPFSPDGFFERQHVLFRGLTTLLGRGEMEPALIQSAREVVAAWTGPETPIPDDGEKGRLVGRVVALQGDFPNLTERQERTDALREIVFTSCLLTAAGLTDPVTALVEKYAFLWPGADRDTLTTLATLELAGQSPNPFERARMRHRLPAILASYYRRYLTMAPEERASIDTILLDSALLSSLRSGTLGPPYSLEEIDRIGIGQGTHLPPARQQPISWEEIRRCEEAIEVRTVDLPRPITELARSIPLPGGGTLWDHLQNVQAVIFVRSLPSLERGLPPEVGSALRLTRTAILKIDPALTRFSPGNTPAFCGDVTPMGGYGGGESGFSPPFEPSDPALPVMRRTEEEAIPDLLGNLAHEAYHIAFAWQVADGRLVTARMLEERNAHLFEAAVLKEFCRIAERRGVPAAVLGRGRARIEDRRRIALAANLPLGYPPHDETVRLDLVAGVRPGELSRYPTRFLRRPPGP